MLFLKLMSVQATVFDQGTWAKYVLDQFSQPGVFRICCITVPITVYHAIGCHGICNLKYLKLQNWSLIVMNFFFFAVIAIRITERALIWPFSQVLLSTKMDQIVSNIPPPHRHAYIPCICSSCYSLMQKDWQDRAKRSNLSNNQAKGNSYFASGLDSFPDAEIADDPGQQEAESQLPAHSAQIVKTFCYFQCSPPERIDEKMGEVRHLSASSY